jgi:hypothetical protein
MRVTTALLLLLLVSVACIPARTPPQLVFTPGAPLVITTQQVDFGSFRLTYPADWRVITSAAEDSPTLLLAAPDDAALILITLREQLPQPSLNSIPADLQFATRRQMTIAGLEVTFWLVTDQTHSAEFRLILEQIITSITAESV